MNGRCVCVPQGKCTAGCPSNCPKNAEGLPIYPRGTDARDLALIERDTSLMVASGATLRPLLPTSDSSMANSGLTPNEQLSRYGIGGWGGFGGGDDDKDKKEEKPRPAFCEQYKGSFFGIGYKWWEGALKINDCGRCCATFPNSKWRCDKCTHCQTNPGQCDINNLVSANSGTADSGTADSGTADSGTADDNSKDEAPDTIKKKELTSVCADISCQHTWDSEATKVMSAADRRKYIACDCKCQTYGDQTYHVFYVVKRSEGTLGCSAKQYDYDYKSDATLAVHVPSFLGEAELYVDRWIKDGEQKFEKWDDDVKRFIEVKPKDDIPKTTYLSAGDHCCLGYSNYNTCFNKDEPWKKVGADKSEHSKYCQCAPGICTGNCVTQNTCNTLLADWGPGATDINQWKAEESLFASDPGATKKPKDKEKPFPMWAIVLIIIVALLCVCVTIFACAQQSSSSEDPLEMVEVVTNSRRARF